MNYLFGDDIILYTENHKDSPKKLLDLINEHYKVVVHKTAYRKLVFLHINNKKEK